MAEYASAIIGIAAFGIQVCKGIVDYYDTYKHQDRAIAKTVQDAKTLQDLLSHVEDSIQNEDSIKLRQGIDQTIGDIVNACDKALRELDTELDKVRTVKVGKDKGISETLVRGVRRLKYPFKASTLMKLSESTGEVRDNLNLAFEIRQSFSLRTLSHSVDDIRDTLQRLRRDQSTTEALKWLRAPDPWIDLYIASEKRHEGTGLWLLNSSNKSSRRYRNWKQAGSQRFLWLAGFAGTGKSVLASSVIRDIAQALPKKSALTFFFFSFRDQSKQSSVGLLASIVQQLSSQTSSDLLEKFHIEHQHQHPSQHALVELVESFASLFDHVYIVIDAIDECLAGSRRDTVIEVLNEMKAILNIHLLVTSREEIDIRQGFQATMEEIISLNNSDVQDDIELLIREHLTTNRKLMKWQRHHPDIEHALSRSSKGMFRWVECQFIQLERCKTLNALEKALHSLPSTLYETYDRIVSGFDSGEKDSIIRALAFLCFSSRPMLVCQLIDAMAIQPSNHRDFDIRDRIEDLDDLFNLLPGLLSLTLSTKGEYMPKDGLSTDLYGRPLDDRRCQKIHFAHASVRDYFISEDMAHSLRDFRMVEQVAHKMIAESSLIYISSTSKRYHYMRPEDRPLDVYPFSVYAIEELSDHLKQLDQRTILADDIIEVFRADGFWIREAVFAPRKDLYLPTMNGDNSIKDPRYHNTTRLPQGVLEPILNSRQQTLLCAVTFLVSTCVVDFAVRILNELIIELKTEGHDTGYLSTLILWLLAQITSFETVDSQNMCRALISLNLIEHHMHSALYQAMLFRHAYWGDLETVIKILPKDNDLMSRSIMEPFDILELQERLELATKSSAMHNLLFFLQTGISSPFCCALEGKKWRLVQYFLDRNCLGWCKEFPQGQLALDISMYAAVYARSLDHVRLLLQEGASVMYKDLSGADFTALYRATVMGELEIMNLLLDHGAEVSARTRFGSTPIHYASRRSSPEAARLLLSRGADLTLVNHLGLTCLHMAVLRSQTDTIEFLLAAGANPFRRSVAGFTPRELLMFHLQKYTKIQGLQMRGPTALQALDEGEKAWLRSHKDSIAGESDRMANYQYGHRAPNASVQENHDQEEEEKARTNQRTPMNDVVDIFIKVPQVSPHV